MTVQFHTFMRFTFGYCCHHVHLSVFLHTDVTDILWVNGVDLSNGNHKSKRAVSYHELAITFVVTPRRFGVCASP